MTDLTPETLAEWREDAEYDVLANGDGGRTPEYTVDAHRILALLNALDKAERKCMELRQDRDGMFVRLLRAERERDEARGDSPSGFWSQREWEDWSNELAGLIPEDDAAQYSNPEGAQESIIMDCFRAYRRERDEAREALARVEAEIARLRERGKGWISCRLPSSRFVSSPDPTDTEGDDR